MVLKSLIFSFFLIFSFIVFSKEKSFKKMQLELGEVVEIDLEVYSNLNLSKKGVVLLSSVNFNTWRIVAHRKGLVLLTYLNSQTKKEVQILIEVLEKSKEENLSELNPYCSYKGVECTSPPLQILGETSSWRAFYDLKSSCLKEKHCSFFLQMTKKGRHHLEKFLQSRLGFVSTCLLDNLGIRLCTTYCEEEGKISQETKRSINHVLEESGIFSYVPIQCENSYKPSSYLVSSRIFLTSENFAREAGVSKFFLNKIIDQDFSFRANLFKELKAHENGSEFEIIGTPILKVREGKKSFSRTGGEISMMKEKKFYRENQSFLEWKSYGLEFSAKVHKVSKEDIHVSYELKMISPSGSNSKISFQNIGLKGETLLRLKEAQVVGTTDYKRKKVSNYRNIFLASIPIIGPLFKLKKSEKVLSKMVLALKVEEVL